MIDFSKTSWGLKFNSAFDIDMMYIEKIRKENEMKRKCMAICILRGQHMIVNRLILQNSLDICLKSPFIRKCLKAITSGKMYQYVLRLSLTRFAMESIGSWGADVQQGIWC